MGSWHYTGIYYDYSAHCDYSLYYDYSVHSDYSDYSIYRFATQFLPINYYITMMSTVSIVSTISTRVFRHCYQASTNQLLNHYDAYNIYSLYSLYKDFQGLLMCLR